MHIFYSISQQNPLKSCTKYLQVSRENHKRHLFFSFACDFQSSFFFFIISLETEKQLPRISKCSFINMLAGVDCLVKKSRADLSPSIQNDFGPKPPRCKGP